MANNNNAESESQDRLPNNEFSRESLALLSSTQVEGNKSESSETHFSPTSIRNSASSPQASNKDDNEVTLKSLAESMKSLFAMQLSHRNLTEEIKNSTQQVTAQFSAKVEEHSEKISENRQAIIEINDKISQIKEQEMVNVRVHLQSQINETHAEITKIKETCLINELVKEKSPNGYEVCGASNLLANLGQFDNTPKTPQPKEFMNQIIAINELQTIPWKIWRLQLVAQHLRGEALTFFRSRMEDFNNLGDFTKAFLDRFWSLSKQQTVLNKIITCSFNSRTDTYSDFAAEIKYFNSLLDNPLSEINLVQIITQKFPYNVQLALSCPQINNLRDLEDCLNRIQTINDNNPRVNHKRLDATNNDERLSAGIREADSTYPESRRWEPRRWEPSGWEPRRLEPSRQEAGRRTYEGGDGPRQQQQQPRQQDQRQQQQNQRPQEQRQQHRDNQRRFHESQHVRDGGSHANKQTHSPNPPQSPKPSDARPSHPHSSDPSNNNPCSKNSNSGTPMKKI
ncbi:putative uncharacterized protein DDB_G0292556 [Nilaparvata lugens]|uniref:putative uncharacterized protein DDB_G0292556 n=1 Tax=Nilaparvata lugens TaxID=108931 RepID=UPI00193C97B5|nr:putative uncharacterized protein DDB_G0292556 [Nilaparvata lugens]XP_039290696.1 putative uncharacterized protein DDB_G0292556 [Nilaparvata lugens]